MIAGRRQLQRQGRGLLPGACLVLVALALGLAPPVARAADWGSARAEVVRPVRASGEAARSRGAGNAKLAASALEGNGAIAGLVTASDTKAPLAGIEVCAFTTAEPFLLECTLTTAGGEYQIDGLPAGAYFVEFFAPEASGLNYLTQFYNGKASLEQAEAVTVVEAATTPAINAVLQPGGELEGRVTDGEAQPIAGIQVCAMEGQIGVNERCGLSDDSGSYAIAGLASGEYQVEFAVPFGSALNYAKQFYKGVPARAQATPVTVTAGGTPSEGIDATLLPGGAVAGQVISAASKAPLGGVLVCALNPAGESERCVITEASGAYTLAALGEGTYRVQFVPFEAGPGYLPQYFDGKAIEVEADPVPVTAGSTILGIDAALQEAGPAPEVPIALLKPAILGGAVEGQTLRLIPGTWANEPTSVSDEWGQCDGTGAIGSCHTVATSSSYTLTAADVGHTIRIREKAANAAGEGLPLFSPPTAVVVAAPGALPNAPPQPPATIALGGSGVLSATARAPTAAQLKALLVRLLTPRGKYAKIGTLAGRRGYSVSFNSLAAGRLQISWYQVPKGARLARAKSVLVASGKVSMKAGGATKLAIKLTRKGRQLLAAAKRTAAKRLTLTAKGVLAPSGRAPLSATRAFTLKR